LNVTTLKKIVHTTINYKIHANDLLQGKLKELVNVAFAEDPLDSDNSDDFYEWMKTFSL